MKVYILADMEGATGVVHLDQLLEGTEYERARKYLTNDVNAAIDGALESDATEIVVCEGHASMRNLLLEEIHEKARVIIGPAAYKKYVQAIGIDETFDAAIFIGFHSKAGTNNTIIPHTWFLNTINYIKVNGIEFGESAINAAICGEFNVPVIAISGDNTLATEIQNTMGSFVNPLTVKNTLVNGVAECFTPKATYKIIKNGIKKAFKTKWQVFKIKPPIMLEICFNSTDIVKKSINFNYVKQISEHKIIIKDNSILEAINKFWEMYKTITSQMPKWMNPNTFISTDINKYL